MTVESRKLTLDFEQGRNLLQYFGIKMNSKLNKNFYFILHFIVKCIHVQYCYSEIVQKYVMYYYFMYCLLIYLFVCLIFLSLARLPPSQHANMQGSCNQFPLCGRSNHFIFVSCYLRCKSPSSGSQVQSTCPTGVCLGSDFGAASHCSWGWLAALPGAAALAHPPPAPAGGHRPKSLPCHQHALATFQV